jgi:hypothetical protein
MQANTTSGKGEEGTTTNKKREERVENNLKLKQER